MIILDTHTCLWWTNESTNLSSRADEAIQQTDLIGIPAIKGSCYCGCGVI